MDIFTNISNEPKVLLPLPHHLFYNVASTPFSSYCTIYTIYFILQHLQHLVSTVASTPFSFYCSIYTIQFLLQHLHHLVSTVPSTPFSFYCSIYTIQCLLQHLHSLVSPKRENTVFCAVIAVKKYYCYLKLLDN